MKKKEKLFIVILFSLSLSTILANVLGQTTYTCEVKIGDEFIFKVTKLDAYFGTMSEINLGDKMKIKITDITEETNYFTIESDYWDTISKSESFGATADDQNSYDVYKDPSDNDAYISLYVLSPVSTYLAEYVEANPDYSSSGNVLTGEYYDLISTITFDSNGIASKMQYSNSTTVLYILSRSGSSLAIPGYDLPILIGLTAITGVSIIYIVKKKML